MEGIRERGRSEVPRPRQRENRQIGGYSGNVPRGTFGYLGNQFGWLLSLYEVVTKGVTLKWYCVDDRLVLLCACCIFSGGE